MSTMTARDFNRDVSQAKRLAQSEPVIITDRGRPSHVLLSIEYYETLSGRHRSIVDMLRPTGGVEIEFDPPRIEGSPRIPQL